MAFILMFASFKITTRYSKFMIFYLLFSDFYIQRFRFNILAAISADEHLDLYLCSILYPECLTNLFPFNIIMAIAINFLATAFRTPLGLLCK